ncbi:MAG TPA: glycosyltransferase [Chthoniobacterales bacterium]|jgi:GT2 family glycosyltransferase|nr:glycosyltransferase [Chthoniobacterales bacterium]
MRCRDVAVAIVTYRRPRELVRLFEGLKELKIPDGGKISRIVVVDNDAVPSAEDICRRQAAELPWPIDYLSHPKKGIASARNRAVDAARSRGAELVAMIDDDEKPAPTWLAELLAAMERYQADVVQGKIVPEFEVPPPRWILAGGFFERRAGLIDRRGWKTGTPLRMASSGNILMKASVFEKVGGFDPFFDLLGGEDSCFFGQAARLGFKMVYCDEAVVSELTPSSRARMGWLLRRAFRTGTTVALIRLRTNPSLLGRLFIFIEGAGLILAAMIGAPLAVLGRAPLAHVLRLALKGCGRIYGSLGGAYAEYA